MAKKKAKRKKAKITRPVDVPGCLRSEREYQLIFEDGPKDGLVATILTPPPEKVAFRIRRYAMDENHPGKFISKKQIPPQWHVYEQERVVNFSRTYRYVGVELAVDK